MADKTIGDLPAASAIYDDDLFLLEQSGEAKKLRGALLKAYLQGFVDAASAASSEAAAALAGVRDAINNIPEGVATPIVNDLTTGGTSMALSAEMGKRLLPLDGSKAMTSALGFTISGQHSRIAPNTGAKALSLYTEATGAGASYVIFNENFLQYQTTQDKVNWKIHDLLHTGNKPSGSYTGNGSATRREIPIGMIGSVLAIVGSNTVALVIHAVGFARNNNGLRDLAGGNIFINSAGNAVLTTTDPALNENGVTYTYFAL